MGRKTGNSGRGKGSSAQGQVGRSKTLPTHQKQTVTAVDEGEGTPGRHKHHDVNSVQHSQEVRQKQAADPSISGLQVGTWMKHSGESECKELTQDSSISAGCELSDIWNCAKCRVIVKEMIDSHPQKDYYVAKLEKDHITHSVVCRQMSEGPSGEQQSDIQSSDVRSSIENLPLGVLPSEAISRRSVEEAEGKEMEVAEESSSAKESQAAEGGHDEEGSGEEDEPGWIANWQDVNKRRGEDNHSWDRSDNQKGRQDKDNRKREEDKSGWSANWRDGNKRRSEDNHSWDRSDNQKGKQDRGTGADNYSRSAGDRGGGGRSMTYKIVKEVDGDLFDAPKECSLAHCVATDMRMGSGIAVNFRQNFKNVGELLEQGARVGQIAVLEDKGRYIYYLVTKKLSTGKPFFEDLVSSLERMREHCTEHGVKCLAMPRIGCGLDRLEWRDVKPKIEEIFSGLDISITIYNFNQRWGTRDHSRSNSEDSSNSLCCKNVSKKGKKKKQSEKIRKESQNVKKGKKKKNKSR